MRELVGKGNYRHACTKPAKVEQSPQSMSTSHHEGDKIHVRKKAPYMAGV